jgi:hypothetical protein
VSNELFACIKRSIDDMTAYKSLHAAILLVGCFSVIVATAWRMIIILSYCLYSN